MSAIDFLLQGLPELSEAELADIGGGYGPPSMPPRYPDWGDHIPFPPPPRPRPGYGN